MDERNGIGIECEKIRLFPLRAFFCGDVNARDLEIAGRMYVKIYA